MSTWQQPRPRFGGNGQQQRQRRDNDLVVFANEKKRSDRDPDFTGHGLVGGVEMWVSMWIKRSKKTGEEFFSLSLRRKDEQRRQPSQEQQYAKEEGYQPAPPQRGTPQYGHSRGPTNFSNRAPRQEVVQEEFIPEFGSDWEKETY